MPRPTQNIIGQKFNRLMVLMRDEGVKTRVICKCECGVEKSILARHVISGATKSCGCWRVENSSCLNLKHGQAKQRAHSRTYNIWSGMLYRCSSPKAKMWAHYGGRGIRVCDRWLKFENFLADMGECPGGYSIERKRLSDNYQPDNCLWIPRADQAKNKTNTRYVLLNGERMIVADAARKLGVLPQTLYKWRHEPRRIPKSIELDFSSNGFAS